MADITVDWGYTKVIYVPKSFMSVVQLVPFEIRELDLNTFRISLKDAEDSVEGMCAPHTHNHNTTVSLGGLTLARVIEILAPYTITFEDGQYAVNLVGANSNVADMVNLNQVQVRSANSAGMIQITGTGSGLSTEEHDQLMGLPDATVIEDSVLDAMTADHQTTGSVGKAISSAGTAGDPWNTVMSGYTDPTTFGGFISKKLLTVAKFLGLK